MTASRTTPTECVFVMQTGVARRPCSASQMVPVISPFPLNEWNPAVTALVQMSPPAGQIAVTPVRATAGVSCTTVVWPTRTPPTSVMAFSGPGGSWPVRRPRSRSRAPAIRLYAPAAARRLGTPTLRDLSRLGPTYRHHRRTSAQLYGRAGGGARDTAGLAIMATEVARRTRRRQGLRPRAGRDRAPGSRGEAHADQHRTRGRAAARGG